MHLYRIAQEQFADDLSGNGAKLFGGRWNSEGQAAVYAASSRALALLETLAHTPAKILQQKIYMLITINIPDAVSRDKIDWNELPAGWDAADTRPFTKNTGDGFLQGRKNLLLSVPSVLVYEENNFVINPLHADMKRLKIINKRRIFFERRVEGNL